ncbi:MAG: DUF3768 domain-containing protein [Chloroflexota bacterium]|nr:DUF3768 domain-containing protein [Chloroflexota bacterium]
MASSDQENCVSSTAKISTHAKLSVSQLNDNLRRNWVDGRVAWTHGIEQLGIDTIIKIFEAVHQFDTFTPDNDPYGEHDFGAIYVNGQRIFWKIDYYDRALEYGSPDPTDPAVTMRVLTVMLASEY